MKVDKILNFMNFFIVEIFLQTEKTWIFVFTAMCCASSVSSLTQGCLRLHATFQKFWRNFCYRSIFAPSVARRLVFVIGLKFRQSIYFASNRNIFLSEKFADQKSTRKSASNHVHVAKMPELSHLNLFTSNPNAQNAENSASQTTAWLAFPSRDVFRTFTSRPSEYSAELFCLGFSWQFVTQPFHHLKRPLLDNK